MSYTLDLLKQLADGLARQFGPDCEIVIHDLKKHDLEHSIVHINNGHVTNRQEGDGPSKVVLETLHKDPASLKDHLGYLTRTSNGKILKSSTIYIRNEEGDSIDYLLSINYDITGLMTVDRSIKALIDTEPQGDVKQQPEQIVHNVNDLLGPYRQTGRPDEQGGKGHCHPVLKRCRRLSYNKIRGQGFQVLRNLQIYFVQLH